tara:strand:+ start:10333 stop:10518 length:186 start_codon:yes stop_codon:yes gene_type:complete
MTKKFADLSQLSDEPIKKLTVKDTDFLLKLIMGSTFEGSELEIAHSVLTKIVKMHKDNLES